MPPLPLHIAALAALILIAGCATATSRTRDAISIPPSLDGALETSPRRSLDSVPDDVARQDSLNAADDGALAENEGSLAEILQMETGEPVSAESGGRPPLGRFSAQTSTGNDLSATQFQVALTLPIPIDPPDRMVMVSPSLGVGLLETSGAFDAPETLYNAAINLMWMERLGDRWMMNVGFSPSIRSDEERFGENIRYFAMGMFVFDAIPEKLQLTFGAAYTGRDDLPVIPMAGLNWQPNDDWRIGVGLPAPKIAHRVYQQESGEEGWVYLSGGIGGGTWDVRRSDGVDDQLSLTEYQALIGGELGMGRQPRLFMETGISFSRKLSYEQSGESKNYGPGLVLQGGLSF